MLQTFVAERNNTPKGPVIIYARGGAGKKKGGGTCFSDH